MGLSDHFTYVHPCIIVHTVCQISVGHANANICDVTLKESYYFNKYMYLTENVFFFFFFFFISEVYPGPIYRFCIKNRSSGQPSITFVSSFIITYIMMGNDMR